MELIHNLINIKKDSEKPNGFISLSLDVSNLKSIYNSIIIISEEWKVKEINGIINLKYGDLNSIGCELFISPFYIKITLDRLSCFPIFYFKKNNVVFITSLWDQIYSNKYSMEIDYINFACMKKFDYIPYNETILKNIYRLNINNCLEIKYKINNLILSSKRLISNSNNFLNPTDAVCNLISEALDKNKKLLLPLSSGLDSRHLLGCALKVTESSNIEAFTYTLVTDKICFESAVAQEICKNNKIKWSSISIENFRNYDFDAWKWNGGLGALNGGYSYLAIENFLRKKDKNNYLVLSGFVGDLLSGKYLREENLNINNCFTKNFIKLPFFLNDDRNFQQNFYNKINKWIELGKFYELNNTEMLSIGKAQYLSFLWKCYEQLGMQFLTPYVNNNFIESVSKVNSQIHKNRYWQKKDIKILIPNSSIRKKYFFNNNQVAIKEGLKIKGLYGLNEVRRCNKNKFVRLIGSIYFSDIYRKIETILICNKPFEIIMRYLFKYLPTYRILNILGSKDLK